MTRLVVPAYFHPAVRRDDWAELARNPARIRLVVLNPASGTGPLLDDVFLGPLERLGEAGIEVAGYVDTGYGSRPAAEVVAEAGRYADWYGVDGVMFDRVSASFDDLGHYASLARAVRAIGVRTLAFNHGAHPAEAYAEHADLLGTFEGPFTSYVDAGIPRWVRRWPAERFAHLVHSVPPGYFAEVQRLASRRNAANVFVTDQGGPNPWHCLPASLVS
ncbi:spherulation-specific family 4 protein [Amycolatopsis sp. NEAU-NG30]|uniref:Spherulation-specific family 4 protein n=1 Tax=Amycolatopsis melonis TaxID=3156488 RepID=A0ABV0LLX5_9PSEU